MLSVAEALARVLADVAPLDAEMVPLADAFDRVLAADVAANLTQPPFTSSAMDGYAVRRADVRSLPAKVKVIGQSAAGHPFTGQIGVREAVRIFTGAPVPPSAGLIVIQENVKAEGDHAEIRALSAEDFIRPAGCDFAQGDTPLKEGRRLTARDVMLAAQMNHVELPMRRLPKVAIIASGDELVEPGEPLGGGQIVSSVPVALAAIVRKAGGLAYPLGIARDTMESLAEKIDSAAGADILVTIGGASVGDHDLMHLALEAAGFAMNFHNIAMRPGKPLMFGAREGMRVLGLPGNPVSAFVGATLFLAPLVTMLRGEPVVDRARTATLAAPLDENGPRQTYMRAKFVDGSAVEALASQDSSLVSRLAEADCLIVRPPYAAPLRAGEQVLILPLEF
jgi:molybdopterin molybdotransferase